MTDDPYYGAMPDPKFELNARVFHRWFGRGRVVQVYPSHPDYSAGEGQPIKALPQNYDVLFDRTNHTAVSLEEKWLERIKE